jgi:phage shock protein E
MSTALRIPLVLLSAVASIALVGCGGQDAVAAPAADPGEVMLIDSAEGKALIESDRNVLVVDVRTRDEYVEGHLVGAQHIPVEDEALWQERVEALDPERPVIVYCRSGRRSEIAAQQLVDAGFAEVYDLGGVQEWDPEDLRFES